MSSGRPTLTLAALRQWLPVLARRTPQLVSAYLHPGRVPASTREATMLGVTSVNRCRACANVHERWGRAAGLPVHDPAGFSPGDAAAYAYGQALALRGPRSASPPADLAPRHRRELEAAGVLMQLANLAGNRFLSERPAAPRRQIGDALTASLYDGAMRVADRAGIRHARKRLLAGARGDVLENRRRDRPEPVRLPAGCRPPRHRPERARPGPRGAAGGTPRSTGRPGVG